MQSVSGSLSDHTTQTFDFIILGHSLACAFSTYILRANGNTVLQIFEGDVISQQTIHRKSYPITQENFLGIANNKQQEYLEYLHRLAPIYMPRKRFLISNFKLEQWTSFLKLKMYEYKSEASADWKNYRVNHRDLKSKEQNIELAYIEGTRSVAVFEMQEEKIKLAILKAAQNNGAIVLTYMELQQFKESEDRFTLQFNDRTNLKEIIFNAKKILIDNDHEKLSFIQNNSHFKPRITNNNEIYIQIPSLNTEIKESHFIKYKDNKYIISHSIDHTTIGILGQMSPKTDAIQNLRGMLKNVFEQQFMEPINSWTNSLESEIIQKSSNPNIVILENKLLSAMISAQKSEKTSGKPVCLPSCFFEKPESYALVDACDAKFDEAKQTDIKPNDFKTLFYRYGNEIEHITEFAYQYHRQYCVEEVWLRAEVRYCVQFEWCMKSEDFFRNRSARLFTSSEKDRLRPIVEHEISILV